MIDSGLALEGWIPFLIRAHDTPPVVDWCFVGEDTFSDPFFEQTIGHCLRKPGNRPPRQTPIDALIDWPAAHPGLAPTAFIFHSSRCGSTLLAQMAAALPGTVVISEASPVDHVLRARVPEETRITWLRALLSALGQQRRGDERHLFVKFDSWHILNLPLMQEAFPHVPCVFMYRDPDAVLASQRRMPGIQTLPGMLDPSVIGLDLNMESVLRLDRDEYCGRVFGAIYAAAVTPGASGRVLLMNYSQLPEAAISQVLEWCALTESSDARERLSQVARFDAKTPCLPFDTAAVSTRTLPSPQAVETAARFVDSHYAQLESIRLGRG